MNASTDETGIPYILSQKGESTLKLTKIDLKDDAAFKYSEDWLQETIFNYPELLPINEIDPVFGTLYPVCRELMINGKRLDNLYINDKGMLTQVECKLWRNPESRRTVVGQILDYAQEFSRMRYEDLATLIKDNAKKTLFELVSAKTDNLSEPTFIDAVAHNLKIGRFLLLIVGDGIQKDTENISEFLQKHAHLNFTFGLVELRLYKIGESDQPDILILPRVLAKTKEIERAVVRIEGSGITIAPHQPESQSDGTGQPKRRGSITEQYFFEQIEKISSKTASELRRLLDSLRKRDLSIDAGEAGIMIKKMDFNFLAFQTDDTIRNYRCGDSDLGKAYLDKLAEILGDGVVYISSPSTFRSTVKRSDGSYFHIQDIIDHQNEWLLLIDWVLEKLNGYEDNEKTIAG